MELKWIEDFLSVARLRSFSRAATERAVTQPALSRRIQALEAWLGCVLLDRSTYPLGLTPAGKLFHDHARELLRDTLEVRALLRGSDDSRGQRLQIAAGHTLSLNFIPRWLKSVQTGFRELRSRVVASNVHDAVLALVEGNCDLLFCYHHPELPIRLDPDRYPSLTLGTERVVPVSVPDRSGGPRFALPGSDQQPVRWLAYAGTSFLGRTVEMAIRQAPLPCHLLPCHESDLAELLKNLALEGEGLAWVPESSVDSELANGRLVRAGGPDWSVALEIRLFRAVDSGKPWLDELWGHLAVGAAVAR